ncbi:RDD family protein [Streptomyces sp. SBR177]
MWTAFLLVSMGLVAATASLDEAAVAALSIASFVLVLVGAPIAVETLSHGRSLGKLALGLRVVREDGGPIRFRHALMRGAMGAVEILMTFGVVACVASLVSERGRRLGDVFAGTLVIRERVAAGPGAGMLVPPPPPWLVGRFAGLDLSAVPDSLWLEVRQYLTRMRQLDPAIGLRLAERLAGELVARTGTPAPPGVPAAAYLAGVVAERQAREARRAFAPGPRRCPRPLPSPRPLPLFPPLRSLRSLGLRRHRRHRRLRRSRRLHQLRRLRQLPQRLLRLLRLLRLPLPARDRVRAARVGPGAVRRRWAGCRALRVRCRGPKGPRRRRGGRCAVRPCRGC